MNHLTELLDTKHRKKEFLCGKDMLDRYFQEQANQDMLVRNHPWQSAEITESLP